MSTLDERTTRRGPDADGGPGVVEQGSRERRRRQRDRERRLRRTVVVAVGLLVLGAVVARAAEDPGTVRAGGVTAADALLAATNSGSAASAASAASAGPAGDRAGDPAPGPTGATGGSPAPASTPATSATSARADAEGNGEEDAAGGATFTVPPAARAAVPDRGAGTVTPVEIPATTNATASPASGRPVTYAVDVEDGLPVSATEFATVVHDVLVDERGWQARDGVRFVPVSPAERAGGTHVDITVTLASPAYTAQLCAPLNTTTQQVSCWNGSRAVLNLARWVLGASTYGDALTEYRTYLVSHEVGHGLGHAHAHCTTPGEPAPVMVQQTKDLEGCVAWPWPTAPS